MIYSFNSKDNVIFSVIKSAFELSDTAIYKSIAAEFDVLLHRLQIKKISYESLKSALTPTQEKGKFEMCFVVDTTQISESSYGYTVFEKLLPLLKNKSTFSILCGDYIDVLNHPDSQIFLKQLLNNSITQSNPTKYQYSNQYFLIYFNRLTQNQYQSIVDALSVYSWFVGYVDVTYDSYFKSYISHVLVHSFIKNENVIITSHPSDCSDDENLNSIGYPFKENGFSVISINEDSFHLFLSYKIDSLSPDQEDISFSFNALFPKYISLSDLKFEVSKDKWEKYLTICDAKNGKKGDIVKKLGFDVDDMERFKREIYKHICMNYIYNLEYNGYCLKFNVRIELITLSGNKRKTTIALMYTPDDNEISIITLT